jgi:beta-ureidopropionase
MAVNLSIFFCYHKKLLHYINFLIHCTYRELDLPVAAAVPLNLELKGYSFTAETENLRPARRVRVGLIQNSIVLPTTDPVSAQRDALLAKIGQIIGVAHQSGVNIVCMQEAWSKS